MTLGKQKQPFDISVFLAPQSVSF